MKQQADIALSDSEIIKLHLKTQDPRYFGMLYRKYSSKVFAKCISILKNEEVARDAMQDIFMKVLLNLSGFGEKSMFSTWVYSITYNYCIDLIRRKKKDQSLFSDDIENAPDVIDEEVPDEYLLELDVKKLRAVLDSLPDGDRLVLLMKYQDDMPIKDIAEVTKKTESAIKMQLKRAKQKAQDLCNEMFPED